MKNIEFLLQHEKESFINKLFNEEIIIYENLDAVNFSFIKDINDEYRFYKKGMNFPLNFYERTFTGLYEKAINYILTLDDNIKKNIKELYRFQFEYFPNQQPNNIFYKNLPKNNLVLTGVFEYDQYGRIKNIFNNVDDLNYYADLLDVGPPPIIFKGVLETTQKQQLINFINSKKDDDLLFFQEFLEIIGVDITETYLGNPINSMIEGLRITFKDDKNLYHYKVINPAFKAYIENSKKVDKISILPIIYAEIITFFSKNVIIIKNFESKKADKNLRYLDLIYRMFKIFYEEKKNEFDDISIDLIPEFFISAHYAVNLDNITDSEVLDIIKKDKIFLAILKIFLNLFKKKRNSKDNFINQNLLAYQNDIYYEIQRAIGNDDINLNESLTFLEFLELSNEVPEQDKKAVEIDLKDLAITEDEIIENEFYDKEKDFWIHLRTPINDFQNSKNRINVVIGSFPIFTKDFKTYLNDEIKASKIMLYNLENVDVYRTDIFKIIHNSFCGSLLGRITTAILWPELDVIKILEQLDRKEIISKIYIPFGTGEYYAKIFEYYRLTDKFNFSSNLILVEMPSYFTIDCKQELKDIYNKLSSMEFINLLDDSIKYLQIKIGQDLK